MGIDTCRYVPLKDVSKMVMGPTILQKDLTASGVPVYSAGSKNEIWGFVEAPVKTYQHGAIIVSARGSIGFPKIPNHDVFTSTQTTIALQPSELIDTKFLLYFLVSVNWQELVSGVAIPMLTITRLGELLVPIPPLDLQKLIVAKMESLLPRLKDAKERLNRIPRLLKKFRQGILIAACSGRLTEDWRIKKSLNSEWDEMALAEIAESISTGPFGTMLHKSDYIKNGIPVINPTNIISNEIIPDLSVTVCSEKAQELSRYLLKENDIILSRRGDLSKCGVVSEREVGWLAGTGTFIVRVKMNPYFFRMVFQNPATQELIYNGSIGSTMPNLNQGILGALKVPNPSPEEQLEIVNQVDRLFNKADSLETKYWIAVARIHKIEQSVLAKAFRGELIDPDPDFDLSEKLDECVTQNIE